MRTFGLLLLAGCTGASDTEVPVTATVSIVGFNTESGGSDPATVADETIAKVRGEGLWGLVEVEDEDAANRYVAAMADPDSDQSFKYVYGTTGWSDRIVLAWDDTRYALESWEELYDINISGDARAPVVGHFRERTTETAFLLMANHLWRTDNSARHQQADMLNAWGAAQAAPTILVGDYNFDWEVDGGETDHDEGYDNLVADGVFEWVRPAELVKTQCSGFNSVLDFSFVGGPAREWPASALILEPGNVYCSSTNEDVLSDHRPVALTITMP